MMEHTLWAIPVTAVLALVGMVFHNNRVNDNKVSRVYKRLDDVKSETDKKFVHVQVCEVLHKQIKEDVTEIKQDVKELLKRNGG
jgi:hypothetical protein